MSRVGPNYQLVSQRRPVFDRKTGDVITTELYQYAHPLRHKGYELFNGRLRPVLVTSPILRQA